jgi:Helix-turn-helix domain
MPEHAAVLGRGQIMSIQAVAWALDQDLPARPKLVLVALANHADHTNGYCWLKASTIAKEASCTPRSIYNFVGALVRNGYIRKALRKGEDGKQRANDYWIMFGREEKPWESAVNTEPSEAEQEPDESASDEQEPQDVVEPHEQISCGETAEPHERDDSRQPVEKHAGSPGPVESAFTRYESLEPSKINPRKDARASSCERPPYSPRTYKPPPVEPPKPMGAIVADKEAKMIFVYEGSRAYEAWLPVKRKETGVSCWRLTTTVVIDGKAGRGWWFPSLFPPEPKTDPPATREQEIEEIPIT